MNNEAMHEVSEVIDNGTKFIVTCTCGWSYKNNFAGNVDYYRAEHIKFFAAFGKMTREKWLTTIRNSNGTMRLLGQGASRDVYKLDAQRVIKIERHVDANAWKGRNQCNMESNAWNNASDAIKPLLAPVLDSGDGWVIMQRAKAVLQDMHVGEFAGTVCRELTESTGMHDLHTGNIGYFGNGVFKIIDYAL